MIKKLVIFLVIILVSLNVFQFYKMTKLQSSILKQEDKSRLRFEINLQRALAELDEYKNSKDSQFLGSVNVELREASSEITMYRESFYKDSFPTYSNLASLFSKIRTDLSTFDQNVNPHINLNSLYEAIEYLLAHKEIVYVGSTEELDQLINKLDTLIKHN